MAVPRPREAERERKKHRIGERRIGREKRRVLQTGLWLISTLPTVLQDPAVDSLQTHTLTNPNTQTQTQTHTNPNTHTQTHILISPVCVIQRCVLCAFRGKMPFHHVRAGLLYTGNYLSRSLSETSEAFQLTSISTEELGGEPTCACMEICLLSCVCVCSVC